MKNISNLYIGDTGIKMESMPPCSNVCQFMNTVRKGEKDSTAAGFLFGFSSTHLQNDRTTTDGCNYTYLMAKSLKWVYKQEYQNW